MSAPLMPVAEDPRPFERLVFHPCTVDDGYDSRPGTIWNLSTCGGYLVMDPMPALGDRLWIRFYLPGDRVPVQAHAVVAWRNLPAASTTADEPIWPIPPGCGVHFVALRLSDQTRLAAAVGRGAAL